MITTKVITLITFLTIHSVNLFDLSYLTYLSYRFYLSSFFYLSYLSYVCYISYLSYFSYLSYLYFFLTCVTGASRATPLQLIFFQNHQIQHTKEKAEAEACSILHNFRFNLKTKSKCLGPILIGFKLSV
jgi:hypothetical protein